MRITLMSSEPVDSFEVLSERPDLLSFLTHGAERIAAPEKVGPIKPTGIVEWSCLANTMDVRVTTLVWTARIGDEVWKSRAPVVLPNPPVHRQVRQAPVIFGDSALRKRRRA